MCDDADLQMCDDVDLQMCDDVDLQMCDHVDLQLLAGTERIALPGNFPFGRGERMKQRCNRHVHEHYPVGT